MDETVSQMYEYYSYIDVKQETPPPLFLNNLSLKRCLILRANTSYCDPVQKDYENAISVCDNARF